jgi:hypothetical protein
MHRAAAVGLLVALAVLGGAAAFVHAPVDDGVTDGDADRRAAAAGDRAVGGESAALGRAAEFDRTRFRIEVFANGSARWQFRYVRVLGTNETERRQFETFAERFNTEETGLYRDFVARAGALTASAANDTDRNMTATAFSRQAGVERNVEDLGVVEMSFTWTAFAQVDGDRVVVGDVFDGGLFLGSDRSLAVVAGPGLQFVARDPEGTLDAGTLADSSTISWQGERDFASGRPRVVLAPTEAVTTAPATGGETTAGGATASATAGTPSETPAADRQASTGGGMSPLLLGMGALVVLAGAGAAVWVRTRGPGGAAGGPTTTSDDGPDGGAAAADDADAAQGEEAVAPAELLSDEDRVVTMLEERGGRMRQVQIVEETDWSKSKVSMLLSDMEDDGEISKLRVGRENIISLDGEEPEAAGSPFDDE